MPAVIEADEIFSELRRHLLSDNALGKLALSAQHFQFKFDDVHHATPKGQQGGNSALSILTPPCSTDIETPFVRAETLTMTPGEKPLSYVPCAATARPVPGIIVKGPTPNIAMPPARSTRIGGIG